MERPVFWTFWTQPVKRSTGGAGGIEHGQGEGEPYGHGERGRGVVHGREKVSVREEEQGVVKEREKE